MFYKIFFIKILIFFSSIISKTSKLIFFLNFPEIFFIFINLFFLNFFTIFLGKNKIFIKNLILNFKLFFFLINLKSYL